MFRDLVVQRAAEHVREAAAERLDPLVEHFVRGQIEDLLGGVVEPTDGSLVVHGHDRSRHRVEQGLGEGLLDGDLLVQQGILHHCGDVLRHDHQALEVRVLERQAGGAVAEEEPAEQPLARLERDDDLGPEQVEDFGQELAGFRVADVFEIGPRDHVPVELEPAHQRILLVVLCLRRVLETAQPGAQPVPLAVARLAENAGPGDHERSGHALHEVLEDLVHVVEMAQRAGESARRQEVGLPRDFGFRREPLGDGPRGLCFQSPVLMSQRHVVDGPRDERLEPVPVHIDVLHGVQAHMADIVERVGAQFAHRHNNGVRPGLHELRQGVARALAANVVQQDQIRGPVEKTHEFLDVIKVADGSRGRQEALHALGELRVAAVQEARRQRVHTSASFRLISGKMMVKVVPFAISLSTSMMPPCSWMIPWATDNPSPVPWLLVVKNGSKIRPRFSA